MSRCGIAALQLELKRQDNLAYIASEVQAVRKRMPWVDMVVLGELSAYGSSLAQAEEQGGNADKAFADMAKSNSVWLVNGSTYEKVGDKIYNVCTVYSPNGDIVVRHRKVYPFLPYEVDVEAGTEATVFEIPGIGKIGILICYDIWFPELSRSLAWQGAEIVINTVMTNTIDRQVEVAICQSMAAINQFHVISVNVAGDLGVGRSAAFGPGGETHHIAGAGREIIALDLDLDHVRNCRARGWNGLGQPLKSFRDGPTAFDVYSEGIDASAPLQALGPMELPGRNAGTNTNKNDSE